MGYVRSADPGCLLVERAEDEIVIRLDAAAIRRGGYTIDPYFGAVVRDIVAGIGVARSDLRRCGIVSDGLVSEAELQVRSHQGTLPLFAGEHPERQPTLFD